MNKAAESHLLFYMWGILSDNYWGFLCLWTVPDFANLCRHKSIKTKPTSGQGAEESDNFDVNSG